MDGTGTLDTVSQSRAVLQEGLEAYSTGDFDAGAGQLGCANGRSPLYAALDAANGDFAGESGKLAAIVISERPIPTDTIAIMIGLIGLRGRPSRSMPMKFARE